jgi:hypothetical protein
MRQVRSHLTYANVMATIAVFLVLGGGTAVALNGTNTVQSDDLGPGAQVKAPDVANNAVGSPDVINESLTGQDIKNRSGVQTCDKSLTARYGAICVDATHLTLAWTNALTYCADLGLRLPTLSEAVVLAKKFDVPDVSDEGAFWTQERSLQNSADIYQVVQDDGSISFVSVSGSFSAICVTNPSA